MNSETEKMVFPAKLSLRIDWAELDMFGHVNNVMFMKYIQASRVNYWEQVGIYQQFLQTKIGPMLASVNCHFKRPLHYPGNIIVQCRMKFIKNTSFSFHHQVLNEQGEIAAEAEDVMVMYDFNKDEKIAFSNEMRKKVEELEEKLFS